MAPPLLFDISGLDLTKVLFAVDEIERINPHRPPMRMLDGIVHFDPETGTMAAFKDVRDDEFWVPGHIPGRPIFPGVLMIEAAAQLASFAMIKAYGYKFVGFAAVDGVKFRRQVVPGDRLLVLGKVSELRRRRAVCQMQGLVDGQLCFEAAVTGMPL